MIVCENGTYRYKTIPLRKVSKEEAECHDYDFESDFNDYPYGSWKIYSKEDSYIAIGTTISGEIYLKSGKYQVIYLNMDSPEEAGIYTLEVDKLNSFEGADTCYLQVLKSAAGYYIGTLEEDSPGFWTPHSRDSQYYWSKRKDAEDALRTGDYPVKF